MKKYTLNHFTLMKQEHEPIVAVTAYDATQAKIVSENGIELILVGDSLGVTVAGYKTTTSVTMKQMIYHTECVARGNQGSFLLVDMPFMSYCNIKSALNNAAKLMRTGAEAVKLEGGSWLADTVYKLQKAGIPVCGHLGLTPQSVFKEGYKIYLNEDEKKQIISDAKILEEAGMQMLVLKCVHHTIAKEITEMLTIPVIGIGAGPCCDGQIIILHDLLGFDSEGSILLKDEQYIGVNPTKHIRNFLKTSNNGIAGAIRHYVSSVKSLDFPNENEIY